MSVRALIDATALGSGRGGDESMLRSLVRGLVCTAGTTQGASDTVLVDPRTELAAEVIESPTVQVDRMPRRRGAVHFGLDMPLYLARRRSRYDVALTVTHAPVLSPVPVALMVTDLSFLHVPELYPASTRRRLQRLVRHQVGRAAVVLTLSEFCRQDIVTSYGLAPELVHVVPLAAERTLQLSDAGRARVGTWLAGHAVRGRFLLYLGNLHPRKNVTRTIRAFAAARRNHPALSGHTLVVAGARWWGSGEADAAAAAPAGSVVLLGRVDDDTRQFLLEEADALLYLSRFEGFGLPPLEAMAASTPVLAADAAALPEVTGGAALLVDPQDDEAIVDGIARIVTDRALRDELVTRGHDRVMHFDPSRTGASLRLALHHASNQSPAPA